MFDATSSLTELLPGAHRGGRFAALLGRIIDWCVIGVILLTPLWFLPITLDVLELNKQTMLTILVLLALVAWAGKALLERSFSLTRSWMHLVVFCFLVGYAITSWFSVDQYLSFVGNVGQMQWAFVTVALFVLFYFVIVNRFRSVGQVYDLVLWFLLGSALAGLYGLLQMLGIHLIGGLAAAKAFNTVGSINALGVFMVVPTVLAASLTVLGCREKTCVLSHESWIGKFWHGVVWATLIIGLLNAIVVDYWVVWAGLLFGDILLVAVPFLRTRRFGHPVTLAVPAVLALLSVLLLLFRTPIDLQLPSEVSPSASHTWQIARDTLRDKPLFGSGPGTWTIDYALHRSVAANVSQFWNIRFERGLSAFLTMVAMLGIVGTALWVILVVSAMAKSGVHLVREKSDDLWQAYLTIFTGWLTLVFLAFLYNYNITHHLAFWFLLALLGVMVSTGSWTWDQRSKSLVGTILSVLFLVISVGAISGVWLAGQRFVAEAQYSVSVASFQKGDDIENAIAHLNSAISLNALNDIYARNLSQAYLIKVGKLLTGQPDEHMQKQAREFLRSAVLSAERAIWLSPANVDNWSNMASLQRAIAGFTPGADERAIAAYVEALSREPNNPVFMNEVGKLHVLRADAYRTLLESPDQNVKKETEANIKTELDQAADWFNRSITSKPDYAEAHFNLGLVYERQGRMNEAVTKLEQVLAVKREDLGVAFQLAAVYARANRKADAISLFEQIVQAEPDYANARWLLAALYEEKGEYDKAIEQVEAVLKTNPENALITQQIDALKKARDEKAVPKPTTLPELIPESISSPPVQNPVQAP